MVPASLVPGDSPLPGLQTAFFLQCLHVVEKESVTSLVSLYIRALGPSSGLHPYDLITS